MQAEMKKEKNKHIINILENKPLGSLNQKEIATIQAHVDHCDHCRHAYCAAEISTLLLKESAAVQFEPSPFFATRVLARLRERQEANEGWAFARLWRATGALVSTMAATVAALAVLTFLIPAQPATQQTTASVGGLYSAEEVLAQESLQESEMTYAQVLTALYGSEEDLEGNDGNSR